MSKKINLSISILCLIEVICMFTPLCLIRKYWEYEKSSVYHGIASVKSRVGINNFEVGSTFGKILAILFLCAAIITAIIYLLNALDKKSALCHKGWLISTIHTIVMSAFLIYSCEIATVDEISFKYTYAFNWMSFIIILLNLLSLLLSIFLKFGKISTVSNSKKNSIVNDENSLNSLFGYKELLDSGIITQEEFEKKKKQIMDL